MTNYNTEKKDLRGYDQLGREHEQNNKRVSDAAAMRNVMLGDLPAETDIKQVKVRIGLSKGPQKPMAEGQMPLLSEETA
jgi:hypothetical protein